MNSNFKIAERLTELRQAKGMSKYALAKKSGVSNQLIGMYENTEVRLNQKFVDRLDLICESLDLTLAEFFRT